MTKVGGFVDIVSLFKNGTNRTTNLKNAVD